MIRFFSVAFSLIAIATFKTETSTPRVLRRLHTTDSFLFVYCSKVKLIWRSVLSGFVDLSVSRYVLPKPLKFYLFLFLFIVLCFQCSLCFGFSVSRKYF